MQRWDISQTVGPDTPAYPGDQVFKVSEYSDCSVRVSSFTMSAHLGTHLDTPAHLHLGKDSDWIDLSVLIGPSQVIDLSGIEQILPEHLLEVHAERVLLKTSFEVSKTWQTQYPYLSVAAARYLRQQHVKLVGIDTPSVDPQVPDLLSHQELLKAGIIILENLRLVDVFTGDYRLIALPLKLYGLEAVPVRAVLESLDE